jgi:hypothetical protein
MVESDDEEFALALGGGKKKVRACVRACALHGHLYLAPYPI